MPELPEVETVARDLRPRIVGATIVGARCWWPRTLRTHQPQDLVAAVAGRRVEAVRRRGKLVVVELAGGATLTIHLKMTGQLFVVPATTTHDPYVRLALELADGREIRFRDIRKFGRVGLYMRDPGSNGPPGDGGDAFAGLGPEPLDPELTLRAFRRIIRRRKGRLKSVLLDQSFLAGVGNIYADEALWAARLHPLRSAAGLRPADERRLHRELRRILAEAIERRGSSIDDYTAPDGDGSMQERLLVYQRTGEPCLRCGRPVRRVVIGGRSTHFCSWCQRLPIVDRAPARSRHGPPRPAMDRAGRGAQHGPDPGRGGPCGRPGPSRTNAARRRHSASAGTGGGRRLDVHPPAVGRPA